MTVTEAFAEWKIHAEMRLSAKTFHKSHRFVLRMFVRKFPDVDVEDINEQHIHEWVNDPDSNACLSTRKLRKAIFGGFLNWCRDKGYIKNTRRPERLARVNHRMLRADQCIPKPGRCFSDAEVTTILAACRRVPKWRKYVAPMVIVMETGLRIGDVLTMEWQQVGKRQLAVVADKTGMWALIPMSDELIRTFAELPNVDKRFVFGPKFESYMYQQNFTKGFASVGKQCGIPDAGFHAIRHWFAAKCRKNNVKPEHLSYMMLHANKSTTTDNYGIAYELELEHPIFATQNKAGGIQRQEGSDTSAADAPAAQAAETQGDLFS